MTVKNMPTWDVINRRVGEMMAHERGEWCGVPMPVAGIPLSIESRNPWSETVEQLQRVVDQEENGGTTTMTCSADDLNWMPRNTWWSKRLRRTVGIAQHQETKALTWFGSPYDYAEKGRMLIDTLRVTKVWPVDAEMQAMERLAEHLRAKPHLFEAYLLTGTFLERSKRSGLFYIFRRGKPTLVYNADTQMLLCALCLHPIGYYERTHAGAMVPTDDVIAHLLLMRADEPLLWRRANQHALDRPEAGL
jgi:hypothetical protein